MFSPHSALESLVQTQCRKDKRFSSTHLPSYINALKKLDTVFQIRES